MRGENREFGSVSRNAVLTATLAKSIRNFAKTGNLDAQGTAAASQGAALLQRILQGSELVQGRSPEPGGLSPSTAERKHGSSEAFREYALALHAIVRSKMSLADSNQLLSTNRNHLASVSKGTTLSKPATNELIRFLRHLNSLFFAELHRPTTSIYQDRLGRLQ